MPKKTYSTGEMAALCSVSQQTIIRCFDAGLIRGFRVPGSRFRRIPHAEAVRFMEENGLSAATVTQDLRFLVVSGDENVVASAKAVCDSTRWDLRVASSAFDAGSSLHERYADFVVVDLTVAGIELLKFAQVVRPNGLARTNGIAAIDPPATLAVSLLEAGVVAAIRRPFGTDALQTWIARYVGL